MAGVDEDPRCPECGEPIGQTATYCMHCSADLTGDRSDQAAEEVGWDGENIEAADQSTSPPTVTETAVTAGTAEDGKEGEKLLDPDGLVDNTLTVVVGIAGGLVVGLIGTIVLFVLTESGAALLFGVVVWLGATAYLVRRRTVQGAVSKGAYAVAVVLLLVPLVAASPAVDGGLGNRGGLLVGLLLFVAVPAGIAAIIGYVAGRFVPEDEQGAEG